jgi:hypothetical protein
MKFELAAQRGLEQISKKIMYKNYKDRNIKHIKLFGIALLGK